jgi:hypothetical protein
MQALHLEDVEESHIRGCAAQLDADVMDGVLSGAPAHEGLRSALHDVWQGHKDDPYKACSSLNSQS